MGHARTLERPVIAPVLSCLLAAALFGAATPASKQLLGSLGPILLAAVMYAGAALAVAPRALASWSAARVDRRNLWRLVGAVLSGGIVGPVLLLRGLSLSSAASVSLWLCLETVATACLGQLFFRERHGARMWLAVVLMVTASVLLSAGARTDARAAWLVAAACLAWGLDNNLTAIIEGFTPAQITFVKGLVAAAVNLAAALLLEPPAFHAPALLQGLLVGALGYGASLLLYVAGARQLGATRSQLLFSTAPIWGLAVAWSFAGEPLHTVQLGAGALMALALLLVPSSKAPVHAPSRALPPVACESAETGTDGSVARTPAAAPADDSGPRCRSPG
jgi:drug/metabolite transporter (DMT)-like permease